MRLTLSIVLYPLALLGLAVGAADAAKPVLLERTVTFSLSQGNSQIFTIQSNALVHVRVLDVNSVLIGTLNVNGSVSGGSKIRLQTYSPSIVSIQNLSGSVAALQYVSAAGATYQGSAAASATCGQVCCPSSLANCGGACADTSTDANNCGVCGNVCSFANASASCSAGQCSIGACLLGFGNCDGNSANGCECPLNTLTNCGSCGQPCSISNGTASCSTGACLLVSCNAGYTNCNGACVQSTPTYTVTDLTALTADAGGNTYELSVTGINASGQIISDYASRPLCVPNASTTCHGNLLFTPTSQNSPSLQAIDITFAAAQFGVTRAINAPGQVLMNLLSPALPGHANYVCTPTNQSGIDSCADASCYFYSTSGYRCDLGRLPTSDPNASCVVGPSFGMALNDAAQTIGFAETSANHPPLIWSGPGACGTAPAIPATVNSPPCPVGGCAVTTRLVAINNSGAYGGWTDYVGDGQVPSNTGNPFIVAGGGITLLTPPPGYLSSLDTIVQAINDSGQAIVNFLDSVSLRRRAFLYDPSQPFNPYTDLTPFLGGGDGVNPPLGASVAVSINNTGQVVGNFGCVGQFCAPDAAFIWDNVHGARALGGDPATVSLTGKPALTTLTSLLIAVSTDPNAANGERALNDFGQILGRGAHELLLTPAPGSCP